MVAKVISGKNIRGLLNYNENKVGEGVAECIAASRFGCEPTGLTFSDKINRFRKVMKLNPKVRTNALHISLNFDPSEKLTNDQLATITSDYMTRIGFGEQPYLVYRHSDAAHPHVHIVTTNIKRDGKRIDIHNLGKDKSEKARKELEIEYELVRAEDRKKHQGQSIESLVNKPVYGKSETKRSISNVVRFVTRSYRYTTLPELNAALKQFNVVADRGAEGTRMYNKKGLVYSLLNEQGHKIGVSIKASSIYGKPTLPYLEKQFQVNEVLRKPLREQVRKAVEKIRMKASSKEIFADWLKVKGVQVMFRQNDEGRVYGVTFVDNKTKTVFNGSDLGKAYSAQGILDQLKRNSERITHKRERPMELDLCTKQLVDDLITARQLDFQSSPLPRRKRKKKRGRSL